MKVISVLNPSKSLGEMPKLRWNRSNVQTIHDSVKKKTSRVKPVYLIALESYANLPDLAAREDCWKVESPIVSCEVLQFGVIAQAGKVEFMQFSPSFCWAVWYILPSFAGHFWTFDSQNTTTDRPCTIWFEQISYWQTVAYNWRLMLSHIFFKKQNVILRISL